MFYSWILRYYVSKDWTAKKLEVLVDVPDSLNLEHLRGSGAQPGEDLQPEVRAHCFAVSSALTALLGNCYGVLSKILPCACMHASSCLCYACLNARLVAYASKGALQVLVISVPHSCRATFQLITPKGIKKREVLPKNTSCGHCRMHRSRPAMRPPRRLHRLRCSQTQRL